MTGKNFNEKIQVCEVSTSENLVYGYLVIFRNDCFF